MHLIVLYSLKTNGLRLFRHKIIAILMNAYLKLAIESFQVVRWNRFCNHYAFIYNLIFDIYLYDNTEVTLFGNIHMCM